MRIAELAQGDARKALALLEFSIDRNRTITPFSVSRAARMFLNSLDCTDVYYDALSALQKSIRASDPNAALFYLESLFSTGSVTDLISRRLSVISAEDVGLGNPLGLVYAVNALRTVDALFPGGCNNSGEGERAGALVACKNVLAELVVYLANSPKDNSTYTAHFAA